MQKREANIVIAALSAVAALALILMSAILFGGSGGQSAFVPPPFEEGARVAGEELLSAAGLTRVYQEGMSFAAYILPEIRAEGEEAHVCFISDAENEVWLRLRVLSADETVLGETGLIRPGEYVERLRLRAAPPDGAQLRLKIMAYEPDTYYSAGAVRLNTTVRSDG